MRLIPFTDLKLVYGITARRGTLRRWCAEGLFPRPVKIGRARIAFIESELEAWLSARAAERVPSYMRASEREAQS